MLVKMTGALHHEILKDLSRPHPFAAERVGFVAGRMGTAFHGVPMLFLTRYHSISDHKYVKDNTVGARIGSGAITWAMQAAYHGRPAHEGIFHIHLHGHCGETSMSRTDEREIPKRVQGFQSVGRDAAHGIIILSLDHGSAWAWLPGQGEAIRAVSISVVGAPLSVFINRRRK